MTPIEIKEYIYENRKIEYVLEILGCHEIVYHKDKDYYSSTQPDGDNEQGVNIKNSKYLNYRSFSRNVSYEDNKDILDFIQYTKNIGFRESLKVLHEILNIEMKYTVKKSQECKIEDPLSVFKKVKKTMQSLNVLDYEIMNDDILDDYMPFIHIDWYREGIMSWTVKKFGLGYSFRYKRNIIPLRKWDTGELLGTNSRTAIKNYKELNIKKYIITESYPKNINLFGLYENYDSIIKAGYVVVYESEKSVLKRDSLNDPTGVALSGHTLSDEQASILIGLNVDIIISMDKDIPINEIRHTCEKLYLYRKVYYTYDKYGILGDKDSIVDQQNEIFNFFIKYKNTYDKSEHKKYHEELDNKGD